MFYISIFLLVIGSICMISGLISAVLPQKRAGERPVAIESITLSLYLLALGVIVAL
jgi:hypothetical protein